MGWKEDLFTWVIQSFAGKYIKDISRDKLSISLYSGEARIEDMSLKDDVIETLLGLPVSVKQSNVSSISIKIPSWTNITSVHVELCVDDVFAVVTPKESHFKVNDDDKYREKMRQVMIYEKNGDISKDESGKSPQSSNPGDESGNDKDNSSWYQRIGFTVLNNAIVKIKNVHLRYEDFMESTGKPWGFGITIKGIELISTNSNWEETIVSHDPYSPKFKMGKVDSFSIYWDHDIEKSKVSSVPDKGSFYKTMLEMISSGKHNYIIEPLTTILKFKINPRRSKLPKYEFFISMNSFKIGFSKEQYVQSMDFMSLLYNYFQDIKIDTKVERPTCAVKKNPKQWWKYAYDRVIEKIRQERRPDFFTLRHEYIKIYAKKLLDEKSLTKPESAQLETIQRTLSKEDILLFRYVANRRVKLNEQKKKEETKNTGWFGWLTGSGGSSNSNNSTGNAGKLTFIQDLGIKVSEKERDEFTGFINALKSDFDSSADIGDDLSSSTGDGKQSSKGGKKLFYVHLGLDSASIALSKESAEICRLNFLNIVGIFENFVFSDSWNFTFGVNEMSIDNHVYKSEGSDTVDQKSQQQPILVLKNNTKENNFNFVIQKLPEAYPECDFYVNVTVMPIRIFAEKAIVHNISDFFALPSNIDTRYMMSRTGKNQDELSEDQILQLAKQSIKVKLEATLNNPTIIYQMKNKRNKGTFTNLMFVAKSLNIFKGREKESAEGTCGNEPEKPDFYERVHFALNDAEFLIGKNCQDGGASTLVDSFTVSGSVGKCKIPPNPEYPQFVVSSSITPIRFDITDDAFSDILGLIPQSNKGNNGDKKEEEKRLPKDEQKPATRKVSVDVNVLGADVSLVYGGKKLVNACGKGISFGVQVSTDAVNVAVDIESGKLANMLRDTTPILDEGPLSVNLTMAQGKPLDVGVVLKDRILATLDIGVLCSLLSFFKINTKPSQPPEVLLKRPLIGTTIAVSAPKGGFIRFLLFDQTSELIGIRGNSVDVSIAIRRLGFSVNGHATGFTAVIEEGNDLLVKNPKHKEILSSKTDCGCAINFAFDSFNPYETAMEYPGYTYLFKVSTETEVRFVFLMNFIINMLNNIMKIVDNAPRPPPVPNSPGGKFVIDINTFRPMIVIPRSFESEDFFAVVPRDSFTLRSKYDDEKRVCEYLFDVGTVDVMNDAGELAGTLTDLDFVYRMPTSTVGITPFWELEFKSAGTLDLKLNKTRYNNLISMVYENFCEIVNRVTPEPKKPPPPPVPSRSLCAFTVEKGINFVLQESENNSDYVVVNMDRAFVSFESLSPKVHTVARIDNLSSRWRNARGEFALLLDTNGTTVYDQENTYTPEKVDMKMGLDCHFISVSPWYDPIKFASGFLFPEQRTFNAMNKNNEYPNRETSYSLKMDTREFKVPLAHANRDFAHANITGCICSIEWNNRSISMKYNGAFDDCKLLYIPKEAEGGEEIQILGFKDENKPASCFVDYRGREGLSLKTRLDKLCATHNLGFIEEMLLFASEVSESTTSELSTQATEIAEKTVTPATYFLDIVLEAPYIVIPERKTHAKLEWDMGQIRMKTSDTAGKKIEAALEQVSLKLDGRTLLANTGVSANADLDSLKVDVVVKNVAMTLVKQDVTLIQDIMSSLVPAQKPPQKSLPPSPQEPITSVEKANYKLKKKQSSPNKDRDSQSPPHTAEIEEKTKSGFTFDFTLGTESLSLLAVDTARFELKSMSLSVGSRGGGKIEARFSTQNIFVEDIRPSAIKDSKFRKILFLDDNPETMDNTHINFHATYETREDNYKYVSGGLSLMTPTLYFVPEAINSVIDFFTTTSDNNNNSSKKKKKDDSKKAEPNTKQKSKTDDDSEAEKALYSVHVTCMFKGSVVIPGDISDSNSQLMILNIDLDSEMRHKTDVQMQGFLNINNFNLYTCLAEHRESTKVAIMKNCLSKLNVTHNYAEDVIAFIIDFPEPVTIVLTYNNIKLITLTFTRLFTKEDSQANSDIQPNDSPKKDNDNSKTDKQNASASTYGINFFATINKYEVILINDISGENLPVLSSSFAALLNWYMPPVAAEAALKSSKVDNDSNLGDISVSAKVYDWALSEWVPFVENWNLDISYKMAQRTLKRVSVRAKKPLVLTVAASSVKALKSIVDTVSSEYESYLKNPDGTITKKRFVPYTFVNETGLPVAIELSDADFGINPGESIPLYDDVIKDLLGLSENSDIPHECMIYWLSNTMLVPINREDTFSYSTLAVRVSVEESGQKKILLRSRFSVKNVSNNTILLGVHMGSKVIEAGTIQPGGEFAIPIRFFEEGSGRPLFRALVLSEKYNSPKVTWSMPFYIYDKDVDNFTIQNDKPIPVNCVYDTGKEGTRMYCVNMETTQIKQCEYNRSNHTSRSSRSGGGGGLSKHKNEDDYQKLYTFIVGPPLILINELPIHVRYRGPGMDREKLLEPSESVHFYELSGGNMGNQLVSLNIDDMYNTKWAENVLAHELNHFKSAKTGKTVTSVRVIVEQDPKKGAKKVARIKANYWVVNETKDTLLLSYDCMNEFELYSKVVLPVCEDWIFLRGYDVEEPYGVSLKDFADKKSIDFAFLKGKYTRCDFVLKASYGGHGPISKKIVCIRPRFVLINNTDRYIFCKFHHKKDAKVAEQAIGPHTRQPIQRNDKYDNPFKLAIRIGEQGVPVVLSLTSVDSFPLHAQVGNDEFRIYDVDIDIKKGITVLRINPSVPEPDTVPQMVIENCLPYDIAICQDCPSGDCKSKILAERNSTTPFGWTYPAERRSISFMHTSSDGMSFEVSRLGTVSTYPMESGKCIVVDVSLRQNPSGGRATRVIKIAIVEKPKTPISGENDDNDGFELIGDEEIGVNKNGKGGSGIEYRVYVGEFGISVINNVPEEVMYVSICGIESTYSQCDEVVKASLKIEKFQVDNQLAETEKMLPSVIHKMNSDRPGEVTPYFLKFHVELKSAGEKYVKEMLIDIIPFSINAEERFLSYFEKTFLSSFAATTSTSTPLTKPTSGAIGMDMTNIDPESTARMTYIETLIMGCLRFSLTFIPATSSSDKLMSAWWYKAFGGIAALENCVLTFDPFCVSDLYASSSIITKRITNFYKAEFKKKLVSVIFSTNITGNPVGFFREVRTGVGCLKDSRGVKGFFSHTAIGAATSLSSVTSSVNSGLRKVSGDTEQRNTQAPKNFGQGVLGGIKSIGTGIGNGFTGIVKAPIKGTKKGGVAGFFKGLGQGVVGVVAQPVAGVFDAVSTINRGITSSLTTGNVSARHPQRIILRKVITPYDFDMYFYYGVLKRRISRYVILREGDVYNQSIAFIEDKEGNIYCIRYSYDYEKHDFLWKYSLEERRRMPDLTSAVINKIKALGVVSEKTLSNVSDILIRNDLMAVTMYKK